MIPVVFRKAFKLEPEPSKPTPQTECKEPVYIRVNGDVYAPIYNKTVKSLVVEGIIYIPVYTAPKSTDASSALIPTTSGKVEIIKIGKITYIPIRVIPLGS